MRGSLVVLTVWLATSAAGAQSRPSFTGSWVAVPELSLWTNEAGEVQHIRVFGERFSAEHGDDQLTLRLPDDPLSGRHPLDSQPHPRSYPGPDGPQHVTVISGWDCARIVLTIISAMAKPDTTVQGTSRTIEMRDDGMVSVKAPWGHRGALIATVYRRER